MVSAGRTAVVTGAGRGIGRAIALSLARDGARVALISRTTTELQAVAAEIGGAVFVEAADVSDPHAASKAMANAEAALGRVDILVNAAGTLKLMPFAASPEDEWWRQIELNLRTAYLCSRAVVP